MASASTRFHATDDGRPLHALSISELRALILDDVKRVHESLQQRTHVDQHREFEELKLRTLRAVFVFGNKYVNIIDEKNAELERAITNLREEVERRKEIYDRFVVERNHRRGWEDDYNQLNDRFAQKRQKKRDWKTKFARVKVVGSNACLRLEEVLTDKFNRIIRALRIQNQVLQIRLTGAPIINNPPPQPVNQIWLLL
jgi:hypothetical protein